MQFLLALGMAAVAVAWHRASVLALPYLPASKTTITLIPGHTFVAFHSWLWTLPQLGDPELALCHLWGISPVIALPIAVVLMRRGLPRRTKKPTEQRGSARWAEDSELFSWLHGKLTSEDRGVVLGQCSSAELDQEPGSDPPRLGILRAARWVRSCERHFAIFGTNGEGKDACVVNPTLLSECSGDSVFVNDPSGETHEATAGWLELGRRVINMTPTVLGGPGCNVLMTVPRNAHAIGEAQRIAAALVGSVEKARSEGLVYAQAAESLITAAILDALYYLDRKSLPGVWESIRGVEASGEKKTDPSPQREWVRDRMDRAPNKHVRAVFEQLLSYDRQVLSGAFSNATLVLGFCGDPIVADFLDRCDFLPDDLRQYHEPLAVFLSIPERDAKRLAGLQRVVIDTLLSGMLVTRKRKRGCLMLLNEFSQMGALPSAVEAFRVIRKYGVTLGILDQSIEQVRATYEGAAKSILGNCHVTLTLGAVDAQVLRELSLVMGTQTLLEERSTEGTSSRPGDLGASRNASTSAGEVARALMTEAEIRELDPREALLVMRSCKPALLKRVPYYADAELNKRSQLRPPTTSFHIEHELPWALQAEEATAE